MQKIVVFERKAEPRVPFDQAFQERCIASAGRLGIELVPQMEMLNVLGLLEKGVIGKTDSTLAVAVYSDTIMPKLTPLAEQLGIQVEENEPSE